jgi:hypothetical protein
LGEGGMGDEANKPELSSKIQNIGGIVYNDLNLFDGKSEDRNPKNVQSQIGLNYSE